MKKVLLGVALLSTFAFSAQDICSDVFRAGDFQKASDCYTNQVKINNSADNNFFAGSSLLQQGRVKEALPYMQKAEQLETKEADLGFIYNRLSMIYSDLGNSELELAYNMKFLNISLKSGNKKNIGIAYGNLGHYYANLKDYNKSLEYRFKSLDYITENEISITYSNIAEVYNDLNNYNKASEFYNKAIELNLKSGDYLSLCNVKANYGSSQYNQKKYSEADKTLSEANKICHNAGDIANEANSLIFLGKSAIKQKNLQLAKSYYDRAKPLVNKSGHVTLLNSLKYLENKIDTYK